MVMTTTMRLAIIVATLAVSLQAAPSRYGMVGLTAGETLRINAQFHLRQRQARADFALGYKKERAL